MKVARLLNRFAQKYKEDVLQKRFFTVLSIDIFVKLSGIILLPVYLRLMSQDEYGLYNYLLSIIVTFSMVLNFGLYIPISKFYHDYKEHPEKGKMLSTIYVLLLAALFAIVGIIYSLGLDFVIIKILFKHPLNYANYRGIILLAIIVSVLSFMLTSFFFTSEKIKQVKQYNITRILCIHSFSILLLFLIPQTNTAELRLEITYILELILLLIFSIYLVKEISKGFNYSLAISALKMGAPIMLSAIFGIVINFSDKFFLEKYGNFKDLSNYYLSVAFASVIPTIFSSIQNAWLPLFMKEKDIIQNVLKTKKLIKNLTLAFTSISLLIWIFFEILLKLAVIPAKYQQVGWVLPILLTTQISAALSAVFNNYLVYFERTYLISLSGLIICFVSIGLSLLLVPAWGIYGAATTAMISNILYFVTYYYLSKKMIRRHISMPVAQSAE